jgi:hypothetical protein
LIEELHRASRSKALPTDQLSFLEPANRRALTTFVVARARSGVLTLVRDLAGDRAFARDRDPRDVLHDAELDAYIEKLAEADEDEARALYLHFHSAYQTHFSDKTHPLAKLFPKPVWAAKHLRA